MENIAHANLNIERELRKSLLTNTSIFIHLQSKHGGGNSSLFESPAYPAPADNSVED